MTGYGGATVRENGVTVFVEIKTVNNRYLKVSLRVSDGYAALESRVENLVRESLKRGTVNVSVRITREKTEGDYAINEDVLKRYVRQLQQIESELGVANNLVLSQMVTLPGVAEESVPSEDRTEKVWPIVEQTVKLALGKLDEMRFAEGRSMVDDLSENCRQLSELIEKISVLAPNVVEQYRLRLTERVERIMADHQLVLDPTDLIREVAVFTDKSDISEEIVRFRSHLIQFGDVMKDVMKKENPKDGCGRKLDFLTQEMFRETNTIGSKANDAEITKNVVEMKTIIERVREMVQNVE